MEMCEPKIIFLDLPTFPKGTLSLSLPVVSAFFESRFRTAIIDLNQFDYSKQLLPRIIEEADIYGLKVSAQNVHIAREVTEELRRITPSAVVMWGGEFPTLQPERCLAFADCVFSGLIDGVVEQFFADYQAGVVHGKIYRSAGNNRSLKRPVPNFDSYTHRRPWLSFMGLPVETSRGCSYGCSFCLVHHMQPNGHKPVTVSQLEADLSQMSGQFVNVIDYNLGTSKEHFIDTARLLGQSGCSSWMGEACLEALDDDDVLRALRDSRCFTIYCGLETTSEIGLRSVAKRQNTITEYRRIIRKVQSYGIQIASGVILALPGQTRQELLKTIDLFDELGLLYIKMTFLTYNPGTTVHRMMKRKGDYPTDSESVFDGNHLSFLPHAVDATEVYDATNEAINRFYSIFSIIRRSQHLSRSPLRRMQFILFSLLYSRVYRDWQRYKVLAPDAGGFEQLLRRRASRGFKDRAAELLLYILRKLQLRVSRARESRSSLVCAAQAVSQ